MVPHLRRGERVLRRRSVVARPVVVLRAGVAPYLLPVPLVDDVVVAPIGIGLDLDLSVAMTVSLEEAVKGVEKRVRLPTGKELNVKIPAGVAAGQQIRLKGQGETAPGHPPGDLLITVSIAPHAFFKVDGSDLRVELPITLYEAVLGGKVRVPTLGSAVELSVPKNTSSGRTFRLKGKGLPKPAGSSGDMFVTTRIVLPDGNDAELEALMQKWRETHPYNPRSDLP